MLQVSSDSYARPSAVRSQDLGASSNAPRCDLPAFVTALQQVLLHRVANNTPRASCRVGDSFFASLQISAKQPRTAEEQGRRAWLAQEHQSGSQQTRTLTSYGEPSLTARSAG